MSFPAASAAKLLVLELSEKPAAAFARNNTLQQSALGKFNRVMYGHRFNWRAPSRYRAIVEDPFASVIYVKQDSCGIFIESCVKFINQPTQPWCRIIYQIPRRGGLDCFENISEILDEIQHPSPRGTTCLLQLSDGSPLSQATRYEIHGNRL